MTSLRFTYITSIIFGILAIYMAASAVPNALLHQREIGPDAARFGSILITFGIGLALILPHHLIPAMRGAAEKHTTTPIRILNICAMGIGLLVIMLSGVRASLWISYPLIGLFFVIFVFPGVVFKGISPIPTVKKEKFEKRTLDDFFKHSREEVRNGPKGLKYFLMVMTLVFMGGLPAYFVGPKAIPTPQWASFSKLAAVISAAALCIMVMYPHLRSVPKNLPVKLWLKVAIFVIFIFGTSMFGYTAILYNLVPIGAASIAGVPSSQTAIVKEVDLYGPRFCRLKLTLRTDVGSTDVCGFPRALLESLSVGDTVLITGKATYFGQTVDGIRLAH